MESKSTRWLKALTSAGSGPAILCAVLLLAYAALPIGLNAVLEVDSSILTLAVLTVFAVTALIIGASIPFFDPWFDGRRPRVVISARAFTTSLWSIFIPFVFVAWLTAPQIPLVAALTGADPATIALLREQFLKAREGWQASFVYINAILSGALIPYTLALMFVHSMRWRWLAAGFFLVFCLSFVEKAFFLKAMVPLLVLVAHGRVKTPFSPQKLLLITIGLLLFVTFVSGSGSQDGTADEQFFSVSYSPHGAIEHIIWRLLAIPLLTAADAIRVFQEEFGEQPFWGATSSLIAGLFDMTRIEFERLVFAAQWGQNEAGTGSANSVYFIEAYVNFGWLGVFVFSLFVGLMMRLFAHSRDEAFRSLWPLFVLGLHSAGLIGLLLSNGFVILFGIALLIRFRGGHSSSPAGVVHRKTLLPKE